MPYYEDMKVLAIDPGYGRCGIAVLEKTSHGEHLVYSDCIETAAADDFGERIAAIASMVESAIAEYVPDCMAIEKLFFAKNQKTAMRVAEVRGALIHIATERDIPVFEYAPAQVKSATTGSGNADKQQIASMVRLLVTIEKQIQYDDEYDAIAIGITHLARSKTLLARSQ